jgi:4-amino-4-deoxy-L-arabinose transferase-like glycosyltransferase
MSDPVPRFAWLSRRPVRLAVLGLFALLVLFALASTEELGGTPVFYARLSRWMADTGDLAAPYRGEQAYLRKPPLLFWSTALFVKVLGPTSLAATLPSRLFGLGAVVLTYLLGRRLYGPATGWVAAVMLVTNATFHDWTTTLRMDSALTFGLLLSLYGYLQGRRRRGPPLFWLGLAIGVLAKGPVRLAPLLLVPVHALLRREAPGAGRVLRWLAWSPPLLLPVVAWYAFLVGQHGMKPFTDVAADVAQSSHVGAWAFAREAFGAYVMKPLTTWWPWLPFLVLGVGMAVRQVRRGSRRARARAALLLVWLGLNLVAAVAKPYHYSRYLMTLVPALAILGGRAQLRVARGKLPRWVIGAVGVITILGGVFFVGFSDVALKDTRPAIREMRETLDRELAAGEAVLTIGLEPPAESAPIVQRAELDWVGFYLGRAARVVHLDDATRETVRGEPLVMVRRKVAGWALDRCDLEEITRTVHMVLARPRRDGDAPPIR